MVTKTERFRCPGCTADMSFDPQSGALKCPYCGAAQAISRSVNARVAEQPYEEYASDGAQRLLKLSDAAVEVTCSGCGATVEFEPKEVTATCPFCTANFVSQPKAADPLIAPNGVLPFSLTKQQATQSVRQWLASRWFAPSQLKHVARPEGIHGVYLPFWTYDAQAYSTYGGQRGDYYYETIQVVERDAQGRDVVRQQQVRRTRWTSVSGSVENSFDDVLVPATRSVKRGRLQQLEPWDLEKLDPYEPAFLTGFRAQRYQVTLTDGFTEAQQMMTMSIENSIRDDIGGDEQQIDDVDTQWSGLSFKHLMLPVWIGAYKFRAKVYQVTVNARTGEVQGERPYSAAKIALLVLAIVIVVIIVMNLSE